MKALFLALVSGIVLTACAGSTRPNYPTAVVAYLDEELPLMENAVAKKDRSFFSHHLISMKNFIEQWSSPPGVPGPIDRYPECTNAVTDYLIVGLCQISKPGTICVKSSFIPKFEKNLDYCRKESKG